MNTIDFLSEYIIEDPALEGQNIDAIKTQFDSYVNIYKQAKKTAKSLSREKKHDEAADEYKKAGKALANTASTLMQIKDDDISLVIGHVVAVIKDVARSFIQYHAFRAGGAGLYHVAGKVTNPELANGLYMAGDMTLGQNPYIIAIITAIKEMLRLDASYKMSKKSKNVSSTNPIRKEASKALLKMSQEMYYRAVVEKRKAAREK